jgi:hypothetical protein
LRLPNAVFHRGNARCGVDDLLVEFATIVADLLDLALELGLVLKRAALLRTQLFELLVALLELVESSGRGGRIQVKRAVARRLRALRLRQRTRNSCDRQRERQDGEQHYRTQHNGAGHDPSIRVSTKRSEQSRTIIAITIAAGLGPYDRPQ